MVGRTMQLCRHHSSSLHSAGAGNLVSGGTIHNFYIYQAQAVQPLGESMSDFDLGQALATAFGVGPKFAGGQTVDQILQTAYNGGTLAKTVTWAQFKTQGYAYNNSTFNESTFKASPQENWYYNQATGSGLQTPSGKVEFFSTQIFQNLATCPWIDIAPVPKYYVRPGGRYGPNASKYPLDLVTPHRLFRFHSMYDSNTLLTDCYNIIDSYGNPHEPAYMSPVTAKAYGLNDGDIVQVFNDQGATLAGVKVTSTLIPGVLQIHQNSWWKPSDTTNPNSLELSGCSNVLTNDQGQSQFARCCPVCQRRGSDGEIHRRDVDHDLRMANRHNKVHGLSRLCGRMQGRVR